MENKITLMITVSTSGTAFGLMHFKLPARVVERLCVTKI